MTALPSKRDSECFKASEEEPTKEHSRKRSGNDDGWRKITVAAQ